MSQQTELAWSISRALDYVVVSVAGDIDAASAPRLAAALTGLANDAFTEVVLDLREVGFLDSSGLATLLSLRRRLTAQGGELILSAPPPAVLRVLEMSGLLDVFTITQT